MTDIKLDQRAVEGLVREFFATMKKHYVAGPTSRARVLEILNALAVAVASVLVGAEDDAARRFFQEALATQMAELDAAQRSPRN